MTQPAAPLPPPEAAFASPVKRRRRAARPPGPPRPSRGARWGIGLTVSTLLLLVGLTGGAVVLVQLTDGGEPCVSEYDAPDSRCQDVVLTETAEATVTWVMDWEEPGEPAPGAPAWLVGVSFEVDSFPKLSDAEWPADLPKPAVGEIVLIAYNPSLPEEVVAPQQALEQKRARQAAAPPPAASPAALWTLRLGLLGCLAAVVGTAVWALRAPRRPRPAPVGWAGGVPVGYGYAPPGYGYPPQPGYGYPPQPGYGYAPQPGYGYASQPGYGYPPQSGYGYGPPPGQGNGPPPGPGYGPPPAYPPDPRQPPAAQPPQHSTVAPTAPAGPAPHPTADPPPSGWSAPG